MGKRDEGDKSDGNSMIWAGWEVGIEVLCAYMPRSFAIVVPAIP